LGSKRKINHKGKKLEWAGSLVDSAVRVRPRALTVERSETVNGALAHFRKPFRKRLLSRPRALPFSFLPRKEKCKLPKRKEGKGEP
jgi:hypothetical protein